MVPARSRYRTGVAVNFDMRLAAAVARRDAREARYSQDPRSVKSRRYMRQQRIQMMGCEPIACYLCFAFIAYEWGDAEPTIEHVISKHRGGTDARDNLEWACKPCNSAKRDQPLDEFLDRVERIAQAQAWLNEREIP
jgi:5-methylcytosine-specific restriction endonuclease McrA